MAKNDRKRENDLRLIRGNTKDLSDFLKEFMGKKIKVTTPPDIWIGTLKRSGKNTRILWGLGGHSFVPGYRIKTEADLVRLELGKDTPKKLKFGFNIMIPDIGGWSKDHQDNNQISFSERGTDRKITFDKLKE